MLLGVIGGSNSSYNGVDNEILVKCTNRTEVFQHLEHCTKVFEHLESTPKTKCSKTFVG